MREFSMLALPMQDSSSDCRSLLMNTPVHHVSNRNQVLLGYLHHLLLRSHHLQPRQRQRQMNWVSCEQHDR
jgi:hypothetical protein